jgi:hypothetical protein
MGSSCHRQVAAHTDQLTGDERGGVGSEEQHRGGDVLRPGQPAKRDRVGQILIPVGRSRLSRMPPCGAIQDVDVDVSKARAAQLTGQSLRRDRVVGIGNLLQPKYR